MGSFFTKTTCRLASGSDRKYSHRFGGKPRFKELIPPNQSHPVTLLYDLDLRDPKLGLNVLFPQLTRLPLLSAMQYNGSELLYHVIDNETVELQPINPGPPSSPNVWMPDFPYPNFPKFLPESPIRCVPYTAKLKEALFELNRPFSFQRLAEERVRMKPYKAILKRHHYPFPFVGDKTFLAQDFPEWKCPSPSSKCSTQSDHRNKQVFAVISARPTPGFHLWDLHADSHLSDGVQLIFTFCKGCRIIHSCNMCD
jgi:hypothetical protein